MIAKRTALFLAAASAYVACGASAWTDLRGLDDLKQAFNRDRGKARIVLLLSPT